MMKKYKYKNIMSKFLFVFIIVLSLILCNFSFNIIAKENKPIIPQIDISFTPPLKRNKNKKIGICIA